MKSDSGFGSGFSQMFDSGSGVSEISDLLLCFSYFASLSKGIKFGIYFFHVCCVNENFFS